MFLHRGGSTRLEFGISLTRHQPSPPASLASILESFRRSGEGDRDLLLSILGAKKAEEEVSETVHRTQSHSQLLFRFKYALADPNLAPHRPHPDPPDHPPSPTLTAHRRSRPNLQRGYAQSQYSPGGNDPHASSFSGCRGPLCRRRLYRHGAQSEPRPLSPPSIRLAHVLARQRK